MGFKDMADADLDAVFYDTQTFAIDAVYQDGIGTTTPIAVLEDSAEVEGVLMDVYMTPATINISSAGKLIINGQTYPIVSADKTGAEYVIIVGDPL